MTPLAAPPTEGSRSTSRPDGGSARGRPQTEHWHVALLLMSGVGLLLGAYTGLGRSGSTHRLLQSDIHGVVMVLGFLGLVIALERATVLGTRLGYVAPAFTAASTLLLATPLPRMVAGILLALAGILVALSYARDLRRFAIHEVTLGAGAISWTAAAVLWTIGSGPIVITPLLAAVLVLTVIGWRLRDGRLRLSHRAYRGGFAALASIFVVGVAISPVNRTFGLLVAGIGLLGLAPGLLRHDIARTELRRGGLLAFSAWSTTLGYVWLGVSGALWIAMGVGATGPLLHDALVHSLFLGFVLSWLMGQAPTLIPTLISTSPVEIGVRYLPLTMLQVSVALRIAADLVGSFAWREMALHGNVAALVAFVVIELVAVRRGASAARPRGHEIL